MEHCIATISGKEVDLLQPNTKQISIYDIAYGLSRIPRFAGHTHGKPYSVAQHSVAIAHVCPENIAVYGLLHDAPEYILGDVCTPLKSLLTGFKEIETRLYACILLALGLPDPQDDVVEYIKKLDRSMYHTEDALLRKAGTMRAMRVMGHKEACQAFLDLYSVLPRPKRYV